ncbi:MAG: hypothetical protein R3D88_09335 [Alphaproteobacteria bacterium]|nr:hypothetical protein [Alphaproteobacteria bacterium]
MQTQDFNSESRAPLYAYQRSPVNERAFLIVKKPAPTAEPVPVGDYTVLDREEDISLSEKKVMNLISLLNGRKRLMQLGHETNSRILYNVISEKDEENKTKVLFYKLGNQGVSKENALFRFECEEEVI